MWNLLGGLHVGFMRVLSSLVCLDYIMGKLHFTNLNYIPDYTLHHKLFKWTFYTINYDICYTSHPNIKLRVTMDRMLNHMTPTWLLLKCHKVKKTQMPSSKSKDPKDVTRILNISHSLSLTIWCFGSLHAPIHTNR